MPNHHKHGSRCSHPSADVILHGCAENIRHVGWHATGVLANPPFTYTTGLTETHGHPELVIAGVDSGMAHPILVTAVKMIEDGGRFTPGDRPEELITGYPMLVAEVPAAYREPFSFGVSTAHYGREVPHLQLMWPDPEGRFPGKAGCDEDMAGAQLMAQ
jgi:hypothetical protein